MQMRLKDGKRKVLTLSYDDGNAPDIRLINILDKYGIKCTFNINSGLLKDSDEVRENPDGKLTRGEVRKYFTDSNHEAAVHTLTHPWLKSLRPEEIIRETVGDRQNLEELTGKPVRGMAYPFGCFTDEQVEILRSCGIVYSRTPRATHGFRFPSDWLKLDPTCHHNDEKLFELADEFLHAEPDWDLSNMFYVWGHTYEFDRDDNWDRIEKFCEYVSGKDDVWYATNIEIYDYVKAYESLITSYDGKIIYNPSAADVWVSVDRKTYKIESGKTVKL